MQVRSLGRAAIPVQHRREIVEQCPSALAGGRGREGHVADTRGSAEQVSRHAATPLVAKFMLLKSLIMRLADTLAFRLLNVGALRGRVLPPSQKAQTCAHQRIHTVYRILNHTSCLPCYHTSSVAVKWHIETDPPK